MSYGKDVQIRNKAFMLGLRKQHPRIFELFYYEEWGFVWGPRLDHAYLQPPMRESEWELPKYLQRDPRERRIELIGSKAIEISIFGWKRYIESHKKKEETHTIYYNLDYLHAHPSLYFGQHNDFKYDIRDHEPNACTWMTRGMTAAEWRKILKTMLAIAKKRYREAKAEERKPKPRNPRRVPFKEPKYAVSV